jgi:hypothetical protein
MLSARRESLFGRSKQQVGGYEQFVSAAAVYSPHSTKHGVDDAMPRFGDGGRTDWFTVMAIVASGTGFLLAGYLLAGLTGFIN